MLDLVEFQLGDLQLRVPPPASPFTHAGLITRTRLIGDGTLDSHNEILQSTALPNRQAQFRAIVFTLDDLNTLRGYHEAMEPVDFTDREGYVHSVVVFELAVTEQKRFFDCTLTLVEVDDETPVGS